MRIICTAGVPVAVLTRPCSRYDLGVRISLCIALIASGPSEKADKCVDSPDPRRTTAVGTLGCPELTVILFLTA